MRTTCTYLITCVNHVLFYVSSSHTMENVNILKSALILLHIFAHNRRRWLSLVVIGCRWSVKLSLSRARQYLISRYILIYKSIFMFVVLTDS